MRASSILIAIVLVALAGGTALWWHASRQAAFPGADADDPQLVARGEAVYAGHCAACHGKRLEGEPDWRSRKPDGTLPAPPHDETGHTWHHPDEMLFEYTKRGGQAMAPPGFRSAMPPFGGILSDAEIWAVLAYIKSQWPDDIRERQAAIDARHRIRQGR